LLRAQTQPYLASLLCRSAATVENVQYRNPGLTKLSRAAGCQALLRSSTDLCLASLPFATVENVQYKIPASQSCPVLQVSIVSFKKGTMEVKAHAWDRNLGGRDLDEVLVRHFADEFKAKHNLDIYTSQKALFRMRTSAERTRQMLTVNPQVLT
jgi:hypothetical protein